MVLGTKIIYSFNFQLYMSIDHSQHVVSTCTRNTNVYFKIFSRRMMEEQERLEWSYREQEIEAIQEERLELLKRMLQQRESDYGAINDKRIEHFW